MSPNDKDVDASHSLKIVIPQCGLCKKTIIKSCLKCAICNKSYHRGCSAKIKKCCEVELSNSTLGDKMSDDSSPMFDLGIKLVNNESTHQDLLLKIISELEAKNSLLIENNSLLKFKIVSLEKEMKIKDTEVVELKKKLSTHMYTDNIGAGVTRSSASGTSVPGCSASADPRSTPVTIDAVTSESATVAPISSRKVKFTREESVPTIHSVHREKLPKQLSGSSSDADKRVETNENRGSEWKVVNRKRPIRKTRKSLVTGSYTGAAEVEGLDKIVALHVSNLKPETSVENLEHFLNRNFTYVKCEKLTSRYPDSYSSFKVLISSCDYGKALNGANWPNKVNVHRFFQRRVTQHPVG